ncbi:hypothetical protein ABGB19_03900 [Mycobacterium sp. B14F4]|uniref:hypothetical protein n=1 Tax=Mycobacterium sp. B14F4 TaxID=3153565 RepID=UPI00325CB023
MTTHLDTQSQTATVAAAWAASPLGQPGQDEYVADERIIEEPVDERSPVARHALLATALAVGVGAGTAVALMLFDAGPAQETVVVPGTAPEHAVLVTDSAAPTTSVAPAHDRRGLDVNTPPAVAPHEQTVVVNTAPPAQPPAPAQHPTPEQPSAPEEPSGEDPQEPPQPPPPPVVDDFKLPEPPAPEPDPLPDPGPPIFVPPLNLGS